MRNAGEAKKSENDERVVNFTISPKQKLKVAKNGNEKVVVLRR